MDRGKHKVLTNDMGYSQKPIVVIVLLDYARSIGGNHKCEQIYVGCSWAEIVYFAQLAVGAVSCYSVRLIGQLIDLPLDRFQQYLHPA